VLRHAATARKTAPLQKLKRSLASVRCEALWLLPGAGGESLDRLPTASHVLLVLHVPLCVSVFFVASNVLGARGRATWTRDASHVTASRARQSQYVACIMAAGVHSERRRVVGACFLRCCLRHVWSRLLTRLHGSRSAGACQELA